MVGKTYWMEGKEKRRWEYLNARGESALRGVREFPWRCLQNTSRDVAGYLFFASDATT